MSLNFNLTGLIVLTGLPGAGKTLYMMQVAEAAVKEGRPTFHCGINGMCLPGVQEWEDPHAWKDLPPRAVLLVDEAQDHFRARPGSVAVPKSITDMERIRHSGICMVMTTQQPTYLDKHVRGLSQHHHLVEILAGRQSNVYRFRSVREDITPTALADAETDMWSHPKRLYPFYKSAEVHTKKLKLPGRIWFLVAVVALFAAWLVYNYGIKDRTAGDTGESPAGAPAPAGSYAATGGPDQDGAPPMTASEYAKRFIPRFPTIAHSAPAWDDRPVVSNPETVCMSSLPGRDATGEWREATVTCLSEQGTAVELHEGMARRLARYGPAYNPFKSPANDGIAANRGGGVSPPVTSPQGAPPSASVIEGDQVTGYGDLATGG